VLLEAPWEQVQQAAQQVVPREAPLEALRKARQGLTQQVPVVALAPLQLPPQAVLSQASPA